MNVEKLLTGRLMALDRSALPALASQAALRAGSASLDQLTRQHAARLMEYGRDGVSVARVGSTAVVPISGVLTPDPLLAFLLGGTSPDAIVRALQQQSADPDVRTIVLLVDSPGGEVSLIQEAAAEIYRLRAYKPIIAIARPLAASAAFWLAAQATTLVATPSANVGSVGVFAVHVEQSQYDEKMGFQISYIASDPKKVEGNPHEPLADDARAFMQARVDEMHRQFVRDLARGRGVGEATVRANFGGGRVFGAVEAQRLGLVDRIQSIDTLLASLPSAGRSGRMASAPSLTMSVDEEHALLAAILSAQE